MFLGRAARGKTWTTREIDGFFYFEFVHYGLRNHLREIRRRARVDTDPSKTLSLGEVVSLDEVQLPFDLLADADIDLQQIAERFGVPIKYVAAAILHGTPLPLAKLAFKIHFEEFPPKEYILRLDIFVDRLSKSDWKLVERGCATWNSMASGPPVPHRPQRLDQGLDMRVQFVSGGVPHLEVMAVPPYPSPGIFVAYAKEQLKKHRAQFQEVRGGTPVALRSWTAYLLAEKCGLTQRLAIRMTNETIGEYCGTYNLDDDARGLSGPVTGSGEGQFSRDKRHLVHRIAIYDEAFKHWRSGETDLFSDWYQKTYDD